MFVSFADSTGKLIQDSGYSASSFVTTGDTRLSDARTPIGTTISAGHLFFGATGDVVTAGAMVGDATFSESGTLALISVATAGTYAYPSSVQIDGKGRVITVVAGSAASAPTGSVLSYAGATAPTGWILLTGASAIRTIGDSSSGADRANADTEDLYTLFWGAMLDAQAPVSSGRGASAAADFAAHKTLTIPDPRGRAFIGVGTGSGLTARVHGATGGAETHQLSTGELAAHTHAQKGQAGSVGGNVPAGGTYWVDNTDYGTTGSTGSNTAHANMQPWLALHLICKL
jgi:hypothetical protein